MEKMADEKSKLDLRFHGKLTPEISQSFNKISYEHRNRFNELVSELSVPHKRNLDWWVQGPASRNAYASPFFHSYCCLCLIDHLVGEGKFDFKEVLVSSPVFRKLVKRFLIDLGVKNCLVRCDSNYAVWLKKQYRKYLSVPVLFLRKLIQLTLAKITRNTTSNFDVSKPFVLIDTFLTPQYVHYDRWYGSFWDNLTDEMKAEVFFVPTIVEAPLGSFYPVYKSLRSDSRNFLIKEDYLKLSDIVYAFCHKLRLKKILVQPAMAFGCDISELVVEEMSTNSDFLTVVESILNYRFIKRLSERGAKLRLAINFFEGQVLDKAWNKALKEFFPDTKRFGYRPYESYPFYLCSYPIPIEKAADVLPDTLAVHGPGTRSSIREFLPDLDVMIVPSFRSKYVLDFISQNHNTNELEILVTLPISVPASVRMIKRLMEAHSSISVRGKNIHYILKPHPTNPIKRIMDQLGQNVAGDFSFTTEQSFPKLLSKTQLLISEGAGSSLDALACGVPVIIIENDEGWTMDPIPKGIPEQLYKKVNSLSKLTAGIEYFANLSIKERKDLKDYADNIKKDYFEPITKEGLCRFLDLSEKQ